MIAYKRIDPNTVVAPTKRTLTQTGKNAAGQDVNNLVVYEKQ